MDFEFSEEHEELRASVRRLLAERAPLSWVRAGLDDPTGTTDDVWCALAELGVTGVLVAEAHGGAGGGMVDAAVVLEEQGRMVHPGPWRSSAIGAAGLLGDAGDAGAAAELLPGLATGTLVGTVALLEPERRYEWRTPTVRASPGGDGWTLRGAKAHVTDVAAADVALVTATDPDGALGIFEVRTRDAGVVVVPDAGVDPTSRTAGVHLADAAARRLEVGPARAHEVVEATIDRLGVAHAVDAVGTASRALELCVEHGHQRVQFGRPIGSFQAVQHLCADMLRAVELARAAAYYACWALDAADPPERHRAATLARAYAAEELPAVGATAIQVFAGIGYTWDHDVHLYYKRLLTQSLLLGGADDHLAELATIALAEL